MSTFPFGGVADLLGPVSLVVDIPARGRFEAGARFSGATPVSVGERSLVSDSGGIFYTPRFKEYFLDELGLVEEPRPETRLESMSLLRRSNDRQILGCFPYIPLTHLSQIDYLVNQQILGNEGPLLTNGRATVFYVLDQSKTARAVFVTRIERGWRYCADPLFPIKGKETEGEQDPGVGAWDPGCRFFFPQSPAQDQPLVAA